MKRIVSVHFPKAAGTSLKTQFMKLLGTKVALDYDHDPLTPAGTETADFPEGKILVMGHFRARRYASSDAFWMTFLRHPVDNLISTYFFWKGLPVSNGLHARFLREQPTILEFASYPGFKALMSETYFGGFDMNRFDFIGFYETRKSDIPRLAKALNLPLVASVYENRTSASDERLEVESDRSLRRNLTDLLAADVAFYERLRLRKSRPRGFLRRCWRFIAGVGAPGPEAK
jgi:hypothetical protein